MTVQISGLALGDLDEIFNYYENQKPGLGQEFITELGRVAERIIVFPRGWTKVSRRTRRCQFDRFPYAAFYSLSAQTAVIIAIWHPHRQDDWRTREKLNPPGFNFTPPAP